MSVLIKGMEMPQSCYMCDMQELSGVVGCEHAYDTSNSEWGRALNCPLIELPDHGDLIDRDALMMKMWEASAYAPNHCSWVNARVVFAKDIEDAPVVVPAERSEDETH